MAANTDPQRRPVFIDRVNQRFLADPAIGGSPWPVVMLSPGMFGDLPGNTLLGRYGSAGTPSALSADVTIDLINTATVQTISAARVVAGSTTQAGVLQLEDSTSSTSTSKAATPNAVKSAYDLAAAASATAATANTTANAALPKAGGTMTGTITFAVGQSIAGYASLSAAQSFTAAQRGSVVVLTPGASVTPDFALGNNFSLNLDQTTVLENPTNIVAGQSGVIAITQDATGRSVSYGSVWKFDGGAPSINATPNSVSVLAYYVESATRITASLVQNSVS